MSGPVTVNLAGVQPERVEWLWPGRIPVGKLVILDGDPAVGKSTISLAVAATVTNGSAWPDGHPAPAGDVLLLSAEDGLADTIRPRLDAAGADVARVHALTEIGFLGDDGTERRRAVTLADVRDIEVAVRTHAAALVIVDVFMAYLPGRVDSHRDQDVRTVLSAVAAMAERTGAAVLLLRHLNKAAGGNPLYRGGGSIGIVGAARAAMLAAVDPDDESRRVLAVTKSNLAAMPEALCYRLVDSPEHGCARVQWEGASEHCAADLLATSHGGEERAERDEAATWLADYMADNGGEVQAADAIRDAGRDGISKTTLHRARRGLGVQTIKGGLRGGWLWRTPRFHEGSEGFRSQGLESTGPSAESSALALVTQALGAEVVVDRAVSA